MDDESIIRLYWDRNDQAIVRTSEKYGKFCMGIARNILGNHEDAEECVNDTYIQAWNSMPDIWPRHLSAFLGRIVRNLSFNRYKREHSQKRGGSEVALVLDELAECVSGSEDVEQAIDRKELTAAINGFVRALPQDKRDIFIRRYWYSDAVSKIARDRGMLSGTVSKMLERIRKQMRAFLTERGFEL